MPSDEGDAEERRADAVARFVAMVTVGEPALDEAALEIAAAAEPATDPRPAARSELDRLAAGVDSLEGLVHRLWVEEGFVGAGEDYYDPRNSSLAAVLRRRRGIPISLAVLAVEVGRRAGVTLTPIGMPGHFLLRPGTGTDRHLDPFTGDLLDLAGCEALFRAATGAGPSTVFGPELLPRVANDAVLVRMLTNLRGIHRSAGDLAELRWVLDMRLALPGVTAPEVAELAETRGRRAEFRSAADLLTAWAEHLPADAERLRRHARTWMARLN